LVLEYTHRNTQTGENEMNKTSNITWNAGNNSTYMTRSRAANTVLGANRAARKFIRNELFGEGSATIYVDAHPFMSIERSIFTKFQWVMKTI
jgi:hypothetical protein